MMAFLHVIVENIPSEPILSARGPLPKAFHMNAHASQSRFDGFLQSFLLLFTSILPVFDL